MLISKLIDFCEYIETLLSDNADALGIEAVYYGDQDRLPVTPAVCVEPDNKARNLKGAQRQTRIDFTAYILIYHSAITSTETNRREADKMADDIESLIHDHFTFDGRVISSLCTSTESGYVTRSRTLLRSSRITVTGQSQQLLPATG